MPRYKIVITRVDSREVMKRGEWTTVDERPWTHDELDDVRAAAYNLEDFLAKQPLKKVFGYTPDTRVTEAVEDEVLKQTVDELDIPAVIKAINNL